MYVVMHMGCVCAAFGEWQSFRAGMGSAAAQRLALLGCREGKQGAAFL